jgi:hypothetical protein
MDFRFIAITKGTDIHVKKKRDGYIWDNVLTASMEFLVKLVVYYLQLIQKDQEKKKVSQIRFSSLDATMNPLFAPPSQIPRVCCPHLGISFCAKSPENFSFPRKTITAANLAISPQLRIHFHYISRLSITSNLRWPSPLPIPEVV